ncbi:uncharacterized protein BYT42DRAFT_598207 [Radiomyces spectabilis]|uniref:uncharacterized protein n=1 Tax=Radiomyces spectabilis TaxID=64574 RepID=UPI00221E7C2F|nr:uncharacterized protein BYT42DRAFT_598207 [Radiomyces spectabilis]KAI8381387.1 hypothetical protein BYT42DRAFT_598207 [Radiomyces spectabilis]
MYENGRHIRQNLAALENSHDPYRAVRKSFRSVESSASGSDGIHSRTASDSSTSRLAPNASVMSSSARPTTYNDYHYYNDDPYANASRHTPNIKPWRLQGNDPDRTNSYLPYSHHSRDPLQPIAPIYIEDDTLSTSAFPEKAGAGSILQDDIVMDMSDRAPTTMLPIKDEGVTDFDPLPELKRKKKRRTCFGLSRWMIAFFAVIVAAVIAVIWYFVWPRVPELTLLDADMLIPTVWTTNSSQSMYTIWGVNLTADNSDNWVPTHIRELVIEAKDLNTNARFGQGRVGPLVLPARSSEIISFNITISYTAQSESDATFHDLYNACGVQVKPSAPEPTDQQELLDLALDVTYHIRGIAWPYHRSIRPENGIVCPTS